MKEENNVRARARAQVTGSTSPPIMPGGAEAEGAWAQRAFLAPQVANDVLRTVMRRGGELLLVQELVGTMLGDAYVLRQTSVLRCWK